MGPIAEQQIPDSTIRYLTTFIKSTADKASLLRAQCLLLRFRHGLPYAEISQVIGWSTGSVRNFHSIYRRVGLSALSTHPRGGRRHFNILIDRERQLLKSFLARARIEGSLNVKALKGAYEHLVGHPCSLSTIYRLIHRHGYSNRLPKARRLRRNP
jgi:transposase